MVTHDERADFLTVAEADRRFNEIDRRLGHIEDRIADLAHGQRSINDRLDKVNDRIDRLDDRFTRADEKADRNFNILNAKIDTVAEAIYARIAAGEDALRRENRWLFGILFALILAIFGMLIRLMV